MNNLWLIISNLIIFGCNSVKLCGWHFYKIDDNVDDLYVKSLSKKITIITKDKEDNKADKNDKDDKAV